ncbi:FkbM family methyltransferase [Rhizobium sp. L51/94]|uniref:FkbM family methyltransferase n=1 Tax=Rhizobium sp. L51/94 TaxID=2819999 RepID=UPI001C5B0124|nr:FkbM family methyltransferase [Rhizobium sp. L51/94]QXZ80901.1 FkbM family methyltransferase [Rhizobium sp. L51/94]
MTTDFITRQVGFMGISFPVSLSPHEQIISEELERSEVWEPNQLVLYPQLVQEGGVFVDVGANVGINSIFMSRIVTNVDVYAIEASAANYQLLVKNAGQGGLKLFNLAIADKDGFIQFSGEGTNAQIASELHPGTASVACQTLDSFIRDNKIAKIDLIKIDVEGFTDVVISGASQSLTITDSAIVEFSIQQVLDRYKETQLSFATKIFKQQVDFFRQFMPHVYYVSRGDGLIRIDDIDELIAMLRIEHDVGDLLFTRREDLVSSSVGSFSLSRISELMRQNHYRLTEIATLSHQNHYRLTEIETLSRKNESLELAVSELKQENHYRIEENVRLEKLTQQLSGYDDADMD